MRRRQQRRGGAWTTPTLAAAILTLTACGSVNEGAAIATLDRLDPLMTAHARALAGEDVAAMRATGRAVIATYDAGRGRP